MLLISSICYSQDIITYRNGTEVKVKVTEVNATEVKFKRTDNIDGPTYTVLKDDLFLIKYENGTKEVFSTETIPTPVTTNKTDNDDDELGYNRIRYNGPRVGFTYIFDGTIKNYIEERHSDGSFVTQFGWQFETRIFTLDNGTSGLIEWILLVGGVEKGMFLPSASMLFGIRGGDKGFEFGIGPNVTATGFGLVLAVGGSFKSGKMYFPINLAFVPSVNHKNSYGVLDPGDTGARLSLLIGFNTRVK